MLENIVLFFVTALTALAIENTVFVRGLGLNKWGLFMNSSKMAILYGVILSSTLTAASLFVALINHLLLDSPYVSYLRAPLYFIVVAGLYIGAHFLIERKWQRPQKKVILQALPNCAFNTALFGALYITGVSQFRAVQTIGYALGAGVGYMLAILVIFYARKRLAISAVPRSFRGLPILLLYIGLLSLSLFGLIGHGLPT